MDRRSFHGVFQFGNGGEDARVSGGVLAALRIAARDG
jgi:hypothetical protein